MQTPALFQRARKREAEKFQKHNIDQFVAPEVKDIVDRVVAAGMKVMYSEEMKDDVQRALQSEDPVGQRMAENVVGLILMMDQRAKPKGIPQAAVFPVAMKLLDEVADVLNAAGQPVTQQDYTDAAQRMFVLLAQKLGVPDDQIMAAAEQYGQPGDDEGAEEGKPPYPGEATEPGEEEVMA